MNRHIRTIQKVAYAAGSLITAFIGLGERQIPHTYGREKPNKEGRTPGIKEKRPFKARDS